MKRYSWKVATTHPEATDAFPFAVVDSKGRAVALAKTKEDAKFFAQSAREISRLGSDATSYRWRYLGQLAARR